MNYAQAISKLDETLGRLEKRLKIDKYDLDGELQDGAHFYNEAAQAYADAVSYRDEAKAHFDGTKAKLDQQIRAEFAAANEKITEGGLNSRVVAHPEYQNAQNDMAAWNDRVLRMAGLQDAIKQRGYAMTSLTNLYIGGYWADQAGSSRAGREVRHEHAEEAISRVAEKERARQAEGGVRGRRKLPEDA